MEMPGNLFKQRLVEHQWQVGLFVCMASAYSMEILAGTGFDWLVIDAEHSPNNPATVMAQLQAAAPYPVQLLVRPMNHDPALIKQYLDAGAQTMLVPLVDDAAQAAALVRAVRYPPEGIRGVAASLARASRWNGVKDYVKHANAEVCLVIQIETRQGLENLDAILAVEGVDAVFIGPARGACGDRACAAAHPCIRQGRRCFCHRSRTGGQVPRPRGELRCGRRRYHSAAQCRTESGGRFPR
jgi:4-hydroxy-2-oxoheptanedioate aldolase